MSSTRRPPAGALLVALALVLAGGAAAMAEEPPERVDEVRVEPDALIEKVELRQLVSVKAPGPWDPAGVERTRSNLLATGRFRSAEPNVTREGGRVRLTFTLVPLAWVRKIDIVGRHQLSRRTLLDRIELRTWRPVPEDGGASVPAEVAEAYERSGLPPPEAAVSIGTPGPDGATRVTLRLTEKPLPRLESLSSELGELPWFTALATRSRFLVQRWGAKLSGFNRKKLDDSIRLEQKRLRGLGWKGAVFKVEETQGEPGDAFAVAVTVRLDLGPREELKGKGIDRSVMKGVSTSWKRRNVPLSEGVVNRLARAATEGMKDRGYLDVSVSPSLVEEGERKTALLTAARGARSFVGALRFDGATSIPTKTLLGTVPLYAPRLLGLVRSHPGPGVLEESRVAVADLYARSGFPDATVSVATEGTGARRTVVFNVVEGKRRTIARLSFPGASAIPDGELRRLAKVKEGDPYWPERAIEVAEALRTEYRRRGFEEAKVTVRAGPPDAGGGLALALEVAEGTASRLGITTVNGNFKTKARRILSLGDERAGKPVDSVQLAEHQTRLSSLGVFDTVSVTSAPVPGSVPPQKDVLVKVTERPTGYSEYGADLNTDRGLELAGTIGERNLFGLATSGSLSVLAGSKRQSLSLELGQPAVFGTRLYNAVRASYVYDATYSGFALQTVSGQIGFSWEFDPKRRLTLVYQLEDQTPVDVQPDVSEESLATTVRIGSLTPTVTLDLRDDPFVPTLGTFLLGKVKVSRRALGGDADYDRWELDGRWYRTMKDLYTVAVDVRAGVAPTRNEEELPVGERFYVGGSTTHRGFREKELGPVGEDGSVLGGESYALGNVELRVPLVGPLEGGVFVDVGNAYLGHIDLGDLRWAAGLGLRIKTPVGPLRVDLGWKLDRQEGESPSVVHFAIGYPF